MTIMRISFKRVVSLLSCLQFIMLAPVCVGAESLTFGIVPQQSASKLAKKWIPVLNQLSKESGIKLRFQTAKDIPTFEQRTLEGIYDIAYMNPYHYTIFDRKPGYRAFAKQKDKMIRGIIVARIDSEIVNLSELEGKTLAFPSPAAFAASILPRGTLKSQHINFTPKYVSSHDSVYRAIEKGLYPAGGGVMRTFNNVSQDIRDQLRILYMTQPYTSHVFAAHPRVSDEDSNNILNAMLTLSDNPEMLPYIKALNFKGFEAASGEQWDDVRSLNIDLLDYMLTEDNQ